MGAPTEQGYPALHQHESPTAMRYPAVMITFLKRPYAHLVVVGVIVLFTAVLGFAKLGYGISGRGLSGYATMGYSNAGKTDMTLLAYASQYGYDGQFYYYIAYRPSLIISCSQGMAHCPIDNPPLRMERIVYPATVWLVALGQQALVPYALLLVNFAAILMTVAVVGWLCVEVGASRWLGAAAGLFCGELCGFLRDLADPLAVMWLVIAYFLIRRERYLLAAGAMAIMLLSREQLLLCLSLLFLPLLLQRRWLLLAQTTLITLTPFVIWQVVLRLLYKSWPLTNSSGAFKLLPLPFLGLWQARDSVDFWLITIGIAFPLVCAAIVAVQALRRQNLRAIITAPLALLVAGYALLLSLTYFYQWSDIWGPSRLAAPAIVLSVIIAAGMPWPRWRNLYGLLIGATTLVPIFSYLRWG